MKDLDANTSVRQIIYLNKLCAKEAKTSDLSRGFFRLIEALSQVIVLSWRGTIMGIVLSCRSTVKEIVLSCKGPIKEIFFVL